jgi:hypothetical protein
MPADRILLSDAVIAALVNAGATTEMIDAARAAACEEGSRASAAAARGAAFRRDKA